VKTKAQVDVPWCGTNDTTVFKMPAPFCSCPATVTPLASGIYVIPVVVHVIHNGLSTPSNVSDAAVNDMIDRANEYLNNRPNTYGHVNGADEKIELRLATKTPIGACTNGIDRIHDPAKYQISYPIGGAAPCPSMPSGSSLMVYGWDDCNYFNIYVVEGFYKATSPGATTCTLSGVAGYSNIGANFVVIRKESVGKLGNPLGFVTPSDYKSVINYNSGQKSNKVFLHEFGHAFGLKHPYEGGGCGSVPVTATNCATTGDNVCDTPPEQYPYAQFATSYCFNTCNSDIPNLADDRNNFVNYAVTMPFMHFTPDQVNTRVTPQLHSANKCGLWQLSNLIATGTDDATLATRPSFSYTLPTATICSGTPFNITITPNIPGTAINWNKYIPSLYGSGAWTVVSTGTGNISDALTVTNNQGIPERIVYIINAYNNGTCVGLPKTIEVLVYPEPTATVDAGPPAVIVCSGACTTIGTPMPPNDCDNYLAYSWLPTTGLSSPNSPTTLACPTVPTTYTLTVRNIIPGTETLSPATVSGDFPIINGELACGRSDAITVNVPQPTAIINPVPILCSGDAPFALSIVPSSITTPGTWSGPGIVPGTNQFNPCSVGVGIYTIFYNHTIAGCAVTSSKIIKVQNCCPAPSKALSQYSGSMGVGSVYTVPSGTYAVNSDIVITSGTVIFENSTFIFASNIKITVQANAKLIINKGSHLYACCSMWDGIYVQPKGNLIVTDYGTTIEDAKNAVVSLSNATNLFGYVELKSNARFNKNWNDVIFKPTTVFNNSIIHQCVFSCSGSAFSGLTPTLKAPYAGLRSDIGINIDATSVQIGSTSPGNNFFENHRVGIYSTNSKLVALSNTFQNSHRGGASTSSVGGHWGVVGVNSNLTIGTSSLQTNVFTNIDNGISASNNSTLIANYNNFRNINYGTIMIGSVATTINANSRCIIYQNNASTSAEINFNTMKNFRGTGIHLFDYTNCTVNITNNILLEMKSVMVPVALPGTITTLITESGIGIVSINNTNSLANILTNKINKDPSIASFNGEAGIYCTNTSGVINGSMNINENKIEWTKYGIITQNLKLHAIRNNNITYRFTSPINAYGIWNVNGNQYYVYQNTIQVDATVSVPPAIAYETKSIGIYDNNCYGAIHYNNSIYGMGSAIRLRNTLPVAYLKCNLMNKCHTGLYIENASLPNQGTATLPQDNQWGSTSMSCTLGVRRIGTGVTTFFHRNATGTQWMPNPLSMIPTGTAITPSPATGAYICSIPCITPPCIVAKLAAAVQKQAPFDSLNATQRYLLDQQLYGFIKNSSDNYAALGLPTDALIASYKDSIQLYSNIGSLYRINKKIQSVDTIGLAATMNSITPYNMLEKYQLDLARVYLKTWRIKSYNYTGEDSITLKNIAYLPYLKGGSAVLDARTMLGLIIDDAQDTIASRPKETMRMLQTVLETTNCSVYPNPANQLINFELNETCSDNCEITIVSTTGSEVYKSIINDPKFSITTSNFAIGTYFYTITNNDIINYSGKFIITR
jgi:hypothetical protein